MNIKEFDDVLPYLSERLEKRLNKISSEIKSDTYEIRIRADKPVVLCGKYGIVFLTENNTVHLCTNELFVATHADINDTLLKLCEYSLYAHQEDMVNGFLTFGEGHRAGICGTVVYEKGKIASLRRIDSVNIRIARNIYVSLKKICPSLCSEGFNGILVCGAPCSGKTTLLKSIAKEISSTFAFSYMKTVIVDERSELDCDTGINCDVIRGYKKLDGIIHATRVMSPDLIVCDEICLSTEAEEILSCCRTGVRFAVSVHCSGLKELFMRDVTSMLVLSGFFDYVLFLDKNDFSINAYKTEELINEFYGRNNSDSELICNSDNCHIEGNNALQYA